MSMVNALIDEYLPFADGCIASKWIPDLYKIRTQFCYPGVDALFVARAIMGIGLKPNYVLLPEGEDIDEMMCSNATDIRYDVYGGTVAPSDIGDGCEYITANVPDSLLFIYKSEPSTASDMLFSICDYRVWLLLACSVLVAYLFRCSQYLWTFTLLMTYVVLVTYSNFLALALYLPPVKQTKSLEEIVRLLSTRTCRGVYLLEDDQPQWFLFGDVENYPFFKDYPHWGQQLQHAATINEPIRLTDFYDFIEKINSDDGCYIGVELAGNQFLLEAVVECLQYQDISFVSDTRLPITVYGLQVRADFPYKRALAKSFNVVDGDSSYTQLDQEFYHNFIRNGECTPTGGKTQTEEYLLYSPLKIRQLQGVFLLLITLSITATVLLILEICFTRSNLNIHELMQK